MQRETAHQWIEQYLTLRARAHVARHLCAAKAGGLDLDCRIGPGQTGSRGVWLWIFGGQVFVFRLSDAQSRQLQAEPRTMTVRLLRPLSRRQPDQLPGAIKDVRFDREPASAGEPITARLTWHHAEDVPWGGGATLEHARPGGGHQQHWAYPAPCAGSGRAVAGRTACSSARPRMTIRSRLLARSPRSSTCGTCRTPRSRGAACR